MAAVPVPPALKKALQKRVADQRAANAGKNSIGQNVAERAQIARGVTPVMPVKNAGKANAPGQLKKISGAQAATGKGQVKRPEFLPYPGPDSKTNIGTAVKIGNKAGFDMDKVRKGAAKRVAGPNANLAKKLKRGYVGPKRKGLAPSKGFMQGLQRGFGK